MRFQDNCPYSSDELVEYFKNFRANNNEDEDDEDDEDESSGDDYFLNLVDVVSVEGRTGAQCLPYCKRHHKKGHLVRPKICGKARGKHTNCFF